VVKALENLLNKMPDLLDIQGNYDGAYPEVRTASRN